MFPLSFWEVKAQVRFTDVSGADTDRTRSISFNFIPGSNRSVGFDKEVNMRKGPVPLSVLFLTAGLVYAQEVENVQVLPFKEKKEISKFMKKKVAKSLGVKCKFCHNMKDYSSDENPHKVVAREMMRMMMNVNQQLTSIQEAAQEAGMEHWEEAPQIDCWVCHRGATKPEYSVPD